MKAEAIASICDEHRGEYIEVAAKQGYYFGEWFKVDLHSNTISLRSINSVDPKLKKVVIIDIGSIVAIHFNGVEE